jgi:2-dehydro-3-deoxyphosphogluconate aldolase/(4S)-4-hydroxy-2-oxoglutarate aldolase
MSEKQQILCAIGERKIILVVRADASDRLVDLALAVQAGGIGIIEITLTTPGAIDAIGALAQRFDPAQMLVGAGTVTTLEQAQAAIDAGARYVVSPAFKPAVVKYCNEEDTVVVPGAFTPTEILTAWEVGADIVKVFPASIGGPAYFRELAGPLPGMRLLPSGGVDSTTASQFLAAGAFAVAVGGAVLGKNLLSAGRFDQITSNAAELVASIAQKK